MVVSSNILLNLKGGTSSMNLEQYRVACGWSKKEMAKQADIDFNTVQKALSGESISMRTVNKLAKAISKELGRTIHVQDIEGLAVRV
jgi:transcriptional regulator with XRE-family HTH domain